MSFPFFFASDQKFVASYVAAGHLLPMMIMVLRTGRMSLLIGAY